METRKFVFLLGNPLVKVAEYEACTEEDAWDQAEFEFGSNTFFTTSVMHELFGLG